MIAREGKSILILLFVLTIVLRAIAEVLTSPIVEWGYIICGILFLFSLNFFRDPKRRIPDGDDIIISPADGKVVRIEKIEDKAYGEMINVSIFLNVFNVHVNRVPFTGTVTQTTYKSGKFLAAFDHKASDENEQAITVFDSTKGTIIVKQIAGLIARRIHCYAKKSLLMKKGNRLGFIMFGSRTDLLIPDTVNLNVKIGDKVKGNETVIGSFS